MYTTDLNSPWSHIEMSLLKENKKVWLVNSLCQKSAMVFFFYAYLQCDLHVLQYNDLTSDHSLLRLLTLLIADLRSIT